MLKMILQSHHVIRAQTLYGTQQLLFSTWPCDGDSQWQDNSIGQSPVVMESHMYISVRQCLRSAHVIMISRGHEIIASENCVVVTCACNLVPRRPGNKNNEAGK